MGGYFSYNDGGRKKAGYKGDAGDCVTRAIAIATQKPYQEVYDALTNRADEFVTKSLSRVAELIQERGATPRNGAFREIYHPYLLSLGWKWTPTMQIGSGCKTHLVPHELPGGRLIVRVSRHLTAMVDGIVCDTFDCSRFGTRCVYGYYSKDNP